MDSKKVKQVKNAFECCSNREIYNCTSCPYRNVSSDCQDNLIYDMGVYINDLESENAYKQEHIELWFKKNEEKKARIAELETKNEVLCVELSRYTEHCVEMKNGTLKQFAERLKEKVHKRDYVQGYAEIGLCEEIDETLKEFADGKV